MRQSDGAVVMSKSKMNPSDAPTFYEIDLMAVKPGKGFYELTLTSTPSKVNAKLTGNEGALLLVKVLGTVSLENVEIGNLKICMYKLYNVHSFLFIDIWTVLLTRI